jgi:hypothetical protein
MRFKSLHVVVLLFSLALLFGSPQSHSMAKKKEIKKSEHSKNADKSQADPENQLLKLDSLEDSYKRCIQRRQSLALSGIGLQRKLEETKDKDEKKKINEQISKIQQELETLNIAMNVVFSPIQPHQYEYNPVKSEIYLKVGNLEQVFIRGVQFREAVFAAIQEQQKKLDDKKNKDKKKELEKVLENLKRQYQTIVASLQIVFDVVPQRNYIYNPNDSSLYLKVTDDEASKIQRKIDELNRNAKDSKKEKKKK